MQQRRGGIKEKQDQKKEQGNRGTWQASPKKEIEKGKQKKHSKDKKHEKTCPADFSLSHFHAAHLLFCITLRLSACGALIRKKESISEIKTDLLSPLFSYSSSSFCSAAACASSSSLKALPPFT